MRFPDRRTVEQIKLEYPPGCRIVLDAMDDAQAPEPGTQWTVLAVDDRSGRRRRRKPPWTGTGSTSRKRMPDARAAES